MKATLFTTGLLLIIISSCQTWTKRHNVSREYLAACETGKGDCPPIQIKRGSKTEKCTVDFSISAFRTSIGLFDSSYLFQIASFKNPDPLRKGFVNDDNKPSLDLTGLPDGKYYVYILGDDVGGITEINIRTGE